MIYLTLFLEFFKMGLFTFGGGYAMIPLIEETVLKYGWLETVGFSEMLGVCESTPGPLQSTWRHILVPYRVASWAASLQR